MIALLRGVTPIGKNKIPKMSYVVEILEEAGFKNVKTFIQSGNVILDTEMNDEETATLIHDTIADKIGAKLSVIIKRKADFALVLSQNPYDENMDVSRIHVTFTNDTYNQLTLNTILEKEYGDELLNDGDACFFMHLPRESSKKVLNNNYLERKLKIVATTRKLTVVKKLYNLLDKTKRHIQW